MILTLIAAACLLCAVALWRVAFSFTIDAAPVGAMMMAASVLMVAISLFLFGIAIGKAHAQTWRIPIPPSAFSICITMMAQAKAAADRKKLCE